MPATRKALERAGLSIDDIDLVELNEAFASQVAGVDARARASTTTGSTSTAARSRSATRSAARAPACWARSLCELRRRGGRYGLATLCIGVGQGLAAIIENPAAA